MAKRIDFKLDKDDYIELGRKALDKNDVETAVNYFRTACRISDDCESYTELGIVYSKLHALALSDAVLYTALSKSKSDEEEDEALWTLCSNALEAGDIEVASYYLRYLGEDDAPVFQAAESDNPKFRVAAKNENEYYDRQLYFANEALADNDFDEALRCVEDMEDAPEPYREAAQKIKTLSFFAKGNFDRVVALSEEAVSKDPSADNRATLATAYSIQERKQEADALLDGIISEFASKGETLPVEIAFKVMPLLIAHERDKDVLYAAESFKTKPQVAYYGEIYSAQALYNTGDVQQAKRLMHKLDNIYSHPFVTEYYLKQFDAGVERVEYSHELPPRAKVEMINRVKWIFASDDLARIQDCLLNDEEFNRALKWALEEGPDYFVCPALASLSRLSSTQVVKIFRDKLIYPELSFDAMMIIIDRLLDYGLHVDIDVVTQNRYKPVYFHLPLTYYELPRRLRQAVFRAACDIVYTDEDPNTYLDRLCAIVGEFVALDGDGNLVWLNKNCKKIPVLRSVETMVGVLLSEVYFDDPDPDEDAMARYNLNERTFRKYKRIFFGDDNED